MQVNPGDIFITAGPDMDGNDCILVTEVITVKYEHGVGAVAHCREIISNRLWYSDAFIVTDCFAQEGFIPYIPAGKTGEGRAR